jgi:hypothetical protein
MSAHGGRLAGLNERDKTGVNLGDVSKKTNCRHQRGAKEPNDHNLQVSAPIRVIH